MAIFEYAFALCALLGTLLVPIFVFCQMLRLKRRAVRVIAPATSHGDCR